MCAGSTRRTAACACRVALSAALCVRSNPLDLQVNIMEACKGFGTDDDALTDILCNRSKEQIARINEVYKKLYETSLLEQVKDECSGDYKRFLVQMISDQATADADSLFKAMDGMGTTERVLSEIIVTNTNAELLQIKKRYEEKYGQPLIDRVNSEVGGDFRTFLVTLLRCERNETAAPDARLAAEQAEAMHKAAKGWGCDEKVFIEILAKSSVAQIDLIQATYERTHSKSLAALIKSEMSGDLEWAMLLNLESRLDASAWLLRYAMEGMGTSEDIIARVMGGASKQECAEIHARFDAKYSRSLVSDFNSELSGNLKKAVRKWLLSPIPSY